MVLFKTRHMLENRIKKQEARIRQLENIICPVAVGHSWKEVNREPFTDDVDFPHFTVTYVCTRCLAVKRRVEL